jgi:hypothetical protein
MSGPGRVRVIVCVRTLTGSRYDLLADVDGRFWVRGQNRVSPTSQLVGTACWFEVRQPQPWPPEPGSPLLFVAPPAFARDDPRRVPGGGKRTSIVVAVERWPGEASEPIMGTPPVCAHCGHFASWWGWVRLVARDASGRRPPEVPTDDSPRADAGADAALQWPVPMARCDACERSWLTVDDPVPGWSTLGRGAGVSDAH